MSTIIFFLGNREINKHTQKIREYFWSFSNPGKTHKGKTSLGGFYFLISQENYYNVNTQGIYVPWKMINQH